MKNVKDHAPSCPVTPCVCEEIPEEMYTKDSETFHAHTEVVLTPGGSNTVTVETPKSEWENELDEMLHNHDCCMRPEQLKSYIRNLLQQQRQEDIERMESVKKEITLASKEISDPYPFPTSMTYADMVPLSVVENVFDTLISYKKHQLTK